MQLNADLLWTLISFILTVLVFSYLFGDNPIFRFVSALFIGVAAGYFTVIIIYQVVLPRLVVPLLAGSSLALIPLVLSGLLLFKLSPRLSSLGNIPMAYLVGAGAAIAIGGAVFGTIFGQLKGVISSFDLRSGATSGSPIIIILEGTFLLVGTLAALAYFNFGAKNNPNKGPSRGLVTSIFAGIGKGFIAITLGAVFAGVLTATITALIERSDFILQTIKSFIR
jgi:ABC-type enterobactin transport system permease subunit